MMLRAALIACCLLQLSAFAQPASQNLTQSEASTKLDADVANLRYDDLVQDIANVPSGPEHNLFAGVLADRTSQFAESIRLLTPFADETNLSRSRMAFVLGSLADDNVKLFHYAEANRLYNRLLGNYADALSPTLLKDDQDDNEALRLLLQAAPQTIDLHGTVDLPTHNDPMGSFVADLTAHGITAPWVFDTGANFSVISETFAKQLGITPSAGIAHTMGATGVENPLHIGVLDELHVGSATLHNIVVLILPDANLTFGRGKKPHIMPAILGYPVFQALGVIRFTHDHHFLAGPTLQTTGTSSPVYMEKLNVLISCKTHDVSRLFQFDSGANATTFFVPYYREFYADFTQQTLGRYEGYGAGGLVTKQVYVLAHAPLQLGGRDVDLEHVAVLTTPQTMLSDHYYGNVGRDLINEFDTLTLDLATDRIYLGRPLQ